MKKLLTLALLFVMAVGANAQFEKGTKFAGASVSGLEMSYNSISDFKFGLQGEGGYFFANNWMAKANVGYGYRAIDHSLDIGLMARYYFDKVGLFGGVGAQYRHLGKSTNDFGIPLEVGYCFFLNDHVSIEPALFGNMSLIDFNDNSEVGFRIGFGYYF